MSRGNNYKASIGGSGNINQDSSGDVVQTVGAAPGREPAAPDTARDAAALDDAGTLTLDHTRNVFVVYGRDAQVRGEVFALLRRLDLRPLEWETLVHATEEGSPFLGRVVADAPSLAQAAVVVLTPDDEVMLHPELRNVGEDRFELRPTLQPRPNVLLELGMVLAVYPRNTIIVEFGSLRPIADLTGRNVIRFNESVSLIEALKKVAGRLENAGCPLDDSGTDWLDTRPFTNLRAYRRKPQ
jgi:predicted nucleotide-binding protein